MIKEETNNQEKDQGLSNPIKDEGKSRNIVIPGETLVSGAEFLPGDGARREGDEIVASKFGLCEINGRFVKVIPLSGTYMPRVGNMVIGIVIDVTFNGWLMDIKAPYNSFLPLVESPRFVKGDLTEFYDIGDMMACAVIGVKPKGVDLTIKERGLGKLEQGMIMFINSNKVPRVIGKEGSMIKIIKQETNCDIVVGQNGVVWIKGNTPEDEFKAKEAILYVVNKSLSHGLTDKVQEFFRGAKK